MSIRDLFAAIEAADLEQVKSLLRVDPALVHQSDRANEPNRPLHRAVSRSRVSDEAAMIVTTLIEAGADVNAPGDYGSSPLHIAIDREQLNVMMELADAGANLNARDGHGQTPLEISVRSMSYSCIGFLLSRGAYIDISISVAFNRIDWVRWILLENPNAVRDAWRSNRLLCDAIQNANLELLELLIASGGTVNPDPGDSIPLWRAVERRRLDMIQLLLGAGADPNGCRPPISLPNCEYPGWTSPLVIAGTIGFSEAEALLKQYGATQ